MPTASAILLSASTASSGSSASTHLNSAKNRALALGITLGTEIESNSSLNQTSLATLTQTGTATLDAERTSTIILSTRLEANIVT